MPAASGASGPTTVRWICSFLAKLINSGTEAISIFSKPFSVAVPPFPGATKTFCTRGLCANFHAIACSRPPEPMTRSFTAAACSVPEVAHAGEHHRDAARVLGSDHFFVAHPGAVAAECDRIGFHVLRDFPCEQQVRPLRLGRLLFCLHFQIFFLQHHG